MKKQLREIIERVVLKVIKEKGWDGIYFIQNQSVKFLKRIENELEKEKYDELDGGDYTNKEIIMYSVECFDRVWDKHQYGDKGFNPKVPPMMLVMYQLESKRVERYGKQKVY